MKFKFCGFLLEIVIDDKRRLMMFIWEYEAVRSIDVDASEVKSIVGNNPRFTSPFSEPYGYYICAEENENISSVCFKRYYEKLKYMFENIDILIQQAYRPEFYNFYGVDRNVIGSSVEMCRQLVIDSFVLYTDNYSIGCYLSNLKFMFGHYIDCLWDDKWNLICSNIC